MAIDTSRSFQVARVYCTCKFCSWLVVLGRWRAVP